MAETGYYESYSSNVDASGQLMTSVPSYRHHDNFGKCFLFCARDFPHDVRDAMLTAVCYVMTSNLCYNVAVYQILAKTSILHRF